MASYFTDSPTIGYDQGPKPMLSDHPVLGPLLQFALPMLGGVDSSGEPFLKLPSITPDTRTATERAFAPNVAAFTRAQRQMSQQMMSTVLTSFGVPHDIANSEIGKMFGQLLMGFTGGGPFTWQDPTYGELSKSVQQNSMRILASRGGFNPYEILDSEKSANIARDVSELYGATHRNIWGENGLKNMKYTYGLTESDIAPIAQAAFETHAQDETLARLRASSEAYTESNKNYSLLSGIGVRNTSEATQLYADLQTSLGSNNPDDIKNELKELKEALKQNAKDYKSAKDEEKENIKELRKGLEFRRDVLSSVLRTDGTINQEALVSAQKKLSETLGDVVNLGDTTDASLKEQRDKAGETYRADQKALEESLAEQTQPWIRAKSLAKTVFGNKAEDVLRTIYGEDLYKDTSQAEAAAIKSAELVAMEKTYGISARQLGNMWMSAANANGSAMGFSNAESAAGFGRFAAASGADSVLYSMQAALDKDIRNNPNMSGDEARRRAGEYAYGFSERYRYAESSEQFRLQTMLQHAKNTGALSEDQFNNLSERLTSGDRRTRETAIGEFFNVAFGGYELGAEIFNDQNRIKMMTAGMSREDSAAIQERLQREVTAEDSRDVKNAELARRRSNVMGTLNQAGLDGRKSQEAYTTGKRNALEAALRGSNASGTGEILSAADEVYRNAISNNIGENEARRRQLEYLERSVSSFIDNPEEANRILQAAEEGGVLGLEALSDKNGEAAGLGSKIQIAFRLGGLSQNETDQLASARMALRNGDVNEARRIYAGFQRTAGRRGALIDKEFARTQRTAQQTASQRSGNAELDKGGAATKSGMSFGAATVMGEPGSTQASGSISAVTKKVLDETDQKTWEQEVDNVWARINGTAKGTATVGLIENVDSNPEERKNSPAVQGAQHLQDMVKAVADGVTQWWNENKGELKSIFGFEL